ncbi:universal stress protein [Modestobacter sp. NPDC049651]|uniref:universal stress protein n=1 Tax=unclassified Modestobacter TaxID=2643866 RepID=UPI0033E871E1
MTTSATPTAPVVCGYDGSALARRAARSAAAEAQRLGVPLHLVHALPWAHAGIVVDPPPGSGSLPAWQTDAEAALSAVAAELDGVLPRDRITCRVEEGHPAEVLAGASRSAQLLVLGSRGLGGVAGLLLGSVASAVAATATCPVVVLPDDTPARVSRRRSVVVGVEGRRGDDEVLAFAFDRAAVLGTDLVAVHAWQDAVVEVAYRSTSPLVDWAGAADDEQRVLGEAVGGWAEKQPDVELREVVVRQRPVDALLAASLTAELLVVGHRRRNRLATLGSTTHGVLHRAVSPVAVVPVAADGR